MLVVIKVPKLRKGTNILLNIRYKITHIRFLFDNMLLTLSKDPRCFSTSKQNKIETIASTNCR